MKVIPHHKREGQLSLIVPLSGGNLRLINNMPGFHKQEGRVVRFRPVAINIAYLLEHMPELRWQNGAEKHVEEYRKRLKERGEQSKQKHNTTIPEDKSGHVYARPPMEHQRKAFMLSRNLPAFGFFMEQGTGKTKVTIDTAVYLYKQDLIDMMVVIAWPNGVHRNWVENELPKDIPADCPYTAAFWSNNSAKWKQKELEAVLKSEGKLKVMTFYPEGFTSQRYKDTLLRCVTENRCLVVIDQSAFLANSTKKRSKFFLNKVAPLGKFRRILDGQPVAKGPEELYSQFLFLDQNILGHDTLTTFKAEFCQIGFFNNILGYKNMDALHRRIDGYSFRALQADCFDLPERIYKSWNFDLTQEERRIYDELKEKEIAYFTDNREVDGMIEEHLGIVKNLRLQQIASGWFPETGMFRAISDAHSRLDALKNLLQQAEGQAIIFAKFRPDLELLQNELGDKAVSYHGGISEDERAAAIKYFQDGEARYFLGQPRSAGLGHTLTAARHVIFYTNDSSLRFREECEKRAHRKGLEETLSGGENLIIWDLVASDTTDRRTLQLLREKKDVATEIMRDPESFFLMEGEG